MQPESGLSSSVDISATPSLVIDGQADITASALFDVAFEHRHVSASADLGHKLAAARSHLDVLISERRRIYGVTTGYGPLATSYVTPELGCTLQRNLVYHLAAGVGQPLPPAFVRGMMLARLAVLARGYSAVDMRAIETIIDWLNAGLVPYVPAKGTVGASGDLTPLAHMAWALMGEGECLVDGRAVPAATMLARYGIEPLRLDHKDGIALVNGTSTMTAIAAINDVRFERLLHLSLQTSLLHAEVMGGKREAWHPAIAEVRLHPGQIRVANRLWQWSAESRRMVGFDPRPPRLEDVINAARSPDHAGHMDERLSQVVADQTLHQDIYSIRCVPQILGAITDLADQHSLTVNRELNAVTDNPLIFADRDMLVHGGNFHGQPVAFAPIS